MINLIRAEFLKIRTTQVWFWLLLAAVALTALLVIAPLASTGQVSSPRDVFDLFTASGTSYVVVFVLGVLGVTTEYRYQTITPTVLATPSRWTLVTGKMIVYALLGALYALICIIVQLAIALPWLSAKNVHITGESHLVRALVGVFVVVTLFGIIGLGFGALIKNQIVAVSVGVIFLLILQNILSVIPRVKVVYPFTPGGAVAGILSLRRNAFDGVTLLPFAGGVVVLLLWAFIPAILGAMFTLTRDIT